MRPERAPAKVPPWWLAVPVMALAVWLAYAPSLGGGRIWDDTFLVQDNPFFRSPVFLFEVFRHWLWIDPIAAYYRPVQNWSYMADYVVWGEWFPGYRLTSLLCHLVAGVLLWRLLTQLFCEGVGARKDSSSHAIWQKSLSWAAWLAALLWLVHPAHNAAVAYVSGRADPLAAVFAIAGWLLWRRALLAQADASAPTRHAVGLALLSVACLLMSLCSRETGLLWLLAFAGWEGIARPHNNRRVTAVTLGASLAVAAVYAWLRTLPPALWPKPVSDVASPGFAGKVLESFCALGDYASLFLSPITLSMERALDISGQKWLPLLLGALAMVASLAALSAASGPARRLRIFFCLWFVAGFFVVCPLVAPNATVAEHWMYFPFAGLLAACAVAATEVANRFSSPARASLLFLTFVWFVFLVTRMHERARDWASNDAFLAATQAHGQKTSRITGLTAARLARAGSLAEAESMLRKAIAANPNDRLLPIYLGSILEAAGRLNEALPLVSFSQNELFSLRGLHPLVAIAPLTEAKVRARQRDSAAALRALESASAVWPDNWSIHAALSALQTGNDDWASAASTLIGFLDRNPWHLDATLRLAGLLSRNNRPDQAVRLIEGARLLDIRSPEPDRLLAAVHADHHQWQKAIAAQKRALSRSHGAQRDVLALEALSKAARQEQGTH